MNPLGSRNEAGSRSLFGIVANLFFLSDKIAQKNLEGFPVDFQGVQCSEYPGQEQLEDVTSGGGVDVGVSGSPGKPNQVKDNQERDCVFG